jgi:Zn-dependent protease
LLHLGSIGGTSIDVDLTFLFLIALFVATNYNASLGLHYALLWAPVVFVSVLVHELAHAAAFAVFGYGASHIVLGGIGGVTVNTHRTHPRPWHDVVISVAGPLASFAIGFLCMQLMRSVPVVSRDPMLVALMPLMVWANVAWGIFNLLPVKPLDGGHATRSFFRMFLRERTAFIISVWIAIIVGGAVVVYFLASRNIFPALLIGWYVMGNVQAWQHFRQTGVPGD